MIRRIFFHITAYIKAIFTAVHVYALGFYYVLYEFFEDYRSGLKLIKNDQIFLDRCKKWDKQRQKKFRNDQKEERQRQEENGKQQDRKLVAVLTGADGTIGSEVLNYLISLDFIVFAVGFSFPPDFYDHDNLRFIKCDLSARNQVFDAIEEIQLGCDQIDLLILNAAVLLNQDFGWFPFSYRRDVLGMPVIERHLAINVLANAQIFASLTNQMEISTQPRALFISSCTARAGDLSSMLHDEERFWCRHLNGYKAYADSKLLLTAYVKYLSRILKSKGSKIKVASVHPGVIPGKLYRHVFRPFRFVINSILSPFMRSPRFAATYILDLAFSDHIQSGAYYENGIPVALGAIEDPDQVWRIGKCVREMIVDHNGHSTTREEEGKEEEEGVEMQVFS